MTLIAYSPFRPNSFEFAYHSVINYILIKISQCIHLSSKCHPDELGWKSHRISHCHSVTLIDPCSVVCSSCSMEAQMEHKKTLLRTLSSDPHRPGFAVFWYISDTLGRNDSVLIARVCWSCSSHPLAYLTSHHCQPPFQGQAPLGRPSCWECPRAGLLNFLSHSFIFIEYFPCGRHSIRLWRYGDKQYRCDPFWNSRSLKSL